MNEVKIRKCVIGIKKSERCKKPYFISIKVQIFHPDTLRRSWQTWYLCFNHYMQFIHSDINDWYVQYTSGKKKGLKCPLLDYKII